MSEHLPLHWVTTELDSLLSFVIGGDWGKANDFDGHDFEVALCIRGAEFKKWDKNKGSSASHRKIKKSSLEKRSLRIGDILLEISGGGPDQPVGRTVLIDKSVMQFEPDIPKTCTNFLRLLRVFDLVNSIYLNYYLRSFYLTGEVKNYQSGSNNLRNLQFREYKNIQIPLPPLNEQTRIANKLDQLLAKVDATQQHLDKIPTLLKRFRQSILAAATSGQLTEEWRGENGADIRQDVVKGKYALNEEIVQTTDLPSSWEWIPLGDFAECVRGKFSVRPRNDPSCFGGEYPFIQIGSLPREGGYIISHKQTLNEKGYSVSRQFNEGTVVIAIVGATIANTGILKYPVCFPDSLVGINSPSDTENVYIDYFLRSIKEDIRLASYAGGGQPNIKLSTLNPLPLPLPSYEEIKEIVRRVEELFALADRIEKQYQAAKTCVDKLTQSILAKAFRGELVPQDPNDEPAEILLKRIQAEREVLSKQTPKKRRVAKKKQIKEVKKMMLEEAPADYLTVLLKKKNEKMQANELWKLSHMSIDDFYEKLRQEEEAELLREAVDNDADIMTENRYLKAC